MRGVYYHVPQLHGIVKLMLPLGQQTSTALFKHAKEQGLYWHLFMWIGKSVSASQMNPFLESSPLPE